MADVGPGGPTLGGSASFAALAAARLGLRAAVVTCAAEGFPPDGALAGVGLHVRETPATTSFENRYDADGRRVQRLLALAPDLAAADVPPAWRRVGVLHLAPVCREVGPEVARAVRADLVGLTPQGWLRRLEVGAAVRQSPWEAPEGLLEAADVVVLSREDLGGEPRGAAWLAAQVDLLVVTDGPRGATAFTIGRTLAQPAFSARALDPTGAGDVFAAMLFVRLWERGELGDALRFAAAAAALAVEAPAAEGVPTRAAVEARLAGGSE